MNGDHSTAANPLPLLRGAAAVALLAVALAGCGMDRERLRWENELLIADRHVDHEAFVAAEADYRRLLATAPTGEFARYIGFRLAYIEELRGDFGEAIAAYEPLWSEGVKDQYAADALFRTGAIYHDELGRQDEGVSIWDKVLSAFPDHTAARKALLEILAHYRRQDDLVGSIAFIEARYPKLKPTDIGDNLMFRKAELLRETGQSLQALAAYRAVMDDHPASGLVDDAQWETAEIYKELGRWEDALTELRFITENRDTSWFVGSYDSQYVDEARFERAMILLEQLDRFDAAIEEFTLFLEEFPTSILRDDARWNIVQAALGAGRGRQAVEACGELAEVEPESRWVDDCQALVAALNEGGASPRSLRTRAVR